MGAFLGNLFGSIIQGITSYVGGRDIAAEQAHAARVQADALRYQADKTYQANVEQIEAQKEQSELAYQRSTTAAQIRQMVDAGISEAQARQIIAGTAQTGQYQPAEIRSTMEGVDYAAPEIALAQGEAQAATTRIQGAMGLANSVGSALSLGGSFIQQSYNAADGGPLGAMYADKFQSAISSYIGKMPAYARGSLSGFQRWLDSEQSTQFKLDNPQIVEYMDTALKTPLGRRAMQSFFDSSSNLLSGEERATYLFNQVQTQVADLAIKEEQKKVLELEQGKTRVEIEATNQEVNLLIEQACGAHYDNILKKYQVKETEQNFELFTKWKKYQYLAQTNELIAQYTATSDPQYIKLYCDKVFTGMQGEIYASLLSAMKDETTYYLLKRNPEFGWICTIFEHLNDAGLLQGIAGQANIGVLWKGEEIGTTVVDANRRVWIPDLPVQPSSGIGAPTYRTQ